MRGWCAVLVALLWVPAALGAPCDQFDPAGPARSARITLDASDFSDASGDELRSFIATGSLGRVEVAVLSMTPPGIVHGVSAVAGTSRFSPHYGESLNGIAVAVALRGRARPARVVLQLRQVCAENFRKTFLYY
jgi:hypothetical protein